MTAAALALRARIESAPRTTRRRMPQKPLDEAQFEALYKRMAGSVWSYLYRLSGDAATADDLVQKTFIRFLRTNPTLENDDHVRRYVFKTATSVALDHFRETKRHRTSELKEQAIESRAAQSELRHDMMRVFAELKPQERALLWLAHVEESNHDEIAGALGVKSKSVRVLLFRARRRLGELLAKKGLGPEVMR
jgi:RNA polymerase sigma-70 factor (ECF subfamily)